MDGTHDQPQELVIGWIIDLARILSAKSFIAKFDILTEQHSDHLPCVVFHGSLNQAQLVKETTTKIWQKARNIRTSNDTEITVKLEDERRATHSFKIAAKDAKNKIKTKCGKIIVMLKITVQSYVSRNVGERVISQEQAQVSNSKVTRFVVTLSRRHRVSVSCIIKDKSCM